MRIKPFQGLRPNRNSVQKIASVPYDVVDRQEALKLAEGNPLSFLHVVRAEIDFPENTDPYDDSVYAKAVDNFRKLQMAGYLVRERSPMLYLYQVSQGNHVQYGIAGLCHVEDYETNLIKKHENTRPAKENDRTRLTSELSANSGPVFLTYRDDKSIDSIVAEIAQGEPLFDFIAEDGVNHRIWSIEQHEKLIAAFVKVKAFYVADGHHRAASAARVARERRLANPDHTGIEDYNWFLSVFFPATQLNILPYNRLIGDLYGMSVEACLDALMSRVNLTPTHRQQPDKPGEVCLYLNKQWYAAKLPPSKSSDPVSMLDVSRLHEHILAPVLAIGDPRTDPRVDFIGGIRGIRELIEKVDRGEAAIAFSLFPVSIDSLLEISDANQIMAPKSTWFEPKLRSGLFIHTFQSVFR